MYLVSMAVLAQTRFRSARTHVPASVRVPKSAPWKNFRTGRAVHGNYAIADSSEAGWTWYGRIGEQPIASAHIDTVTHKLSGRWWLTDHLGSVTRVENDTGGVVESISLDPYGNLESERGSEQVALTFTGKPRDGVMDCSDHGARCLDNKLGMWLGRDKKGQLWTPYGYSINPISEIDKDGEKIEFAPGSSPQFQAEFARAIQYLKQGKSDGIFAKLQARPEVIYLKEGTTLLSDGFKPNNNTITWNPHVAIKAGSTKATDQSPSGKISPARAVLHEADHALQSVQNPAQQQIDAATPKGAYTNQEEFRVIRGSELKSGQALGEGVRTNHSGTPYLVGHADER